MKTHEDRKNRIRIVFEEKKLTQQKFAEDIGMSQSGFATLMTGEGKVSKTLALAIEVKHGYRADWIETGEGEKKSITASMTNPISNMILSIAGEGQFVVRKISLLEAVLLNPTDLFHIGSANTSITPLPMFVGGYSLSKYKEVFQIRSEIQELFSEVKKESKDTRSYAWFLVAAFYQDGGKTANSCPELEDKNRDKALQEYLEQAVSKFKTLQEKLQNVEKSDDLARMAEKLFKKKLQADQEKMEELEEERKLIELEKKKIAEDRKTLERQMKAKK